MGRGHHQHVCHSRGQARTRVRDRVSFQLFTIHMAQLIDSYTLICTSTDYDAWRVGEAPVTVEEVVKTLHTNAGNARSIAAGLLEDVHKVVAEGTELNEIQGSMRFACVTRADVSVSTTSPRVVGHPANL